MGFVPSIPGAFGLALLNMVCWGSWANTMKGCSDWRLEAYYWDYAVGISIWALFFTLTLGMMSTELAPYDFFDVLARSRPEACGWATFSGVLWNVGNVMLVAAIVLAGYSTAFPIGIGTAWCLGLYWRISQILRPPATHSFFSQAFC